MSTMPTKKEVQAVIRSMSKLTDLTWHEACKVLDIPEATVRRFRDVHAPAHGLEFPRFATRQSIAAIKPDVVDIGLLMDRGRMHLRRKPTSVGQLALLLGVTDNIALQVVDHLYSDGVNIQREDDKYVINNNFVLGYQKDEGNRPKLVSSKDNIFRFGVVADSHLGSKYERLDALNDLYDRFEREGITHVYHCGNWIEGESRFNFSDIHTFGMKNQLKYLAQYYPQRKGITTYAVSGDDHEGWYSQRTAHNIGELAENVMRAHGRTDWVDLGYMEAFIDLENANSGMKARPMSVVHPGGGSSYAESYVVQKIIESLDGGEKPSIALYGHYHKMLFGNYRGVWWTLVPSTKDQDTFMRKKRLSSVVGGVLLEAEQDPRDGAIISVTPKLWKYFNKGYYDGRWSPSDEVVLPHREV